MARLPRVYVEGAIYYVTCRSNFNEKLFKEKRDYYMYIELLKKYREEHGFKLFAFVLLPQHLHLLIEPSPEVELSEIMRSLNTAYSKYFNNAYNRRGHLFRERFKATIVEKEPYLVKLTVYTHQNPLRVGVASDFNYPYSSFPLYKEGGSGYEEIQTLCERLEGRSYEEFAAGLKEEEVSFFHKRLGRGGILGSKDFIKGVRDEINRVKEQAAENPPASGKKYVLIGVGVGIAVIASVYGVISILMPQKTPSTIQQTEGAAEAGQGQSVLADIENTVWEARMQPLSGGKEFGDTLSFINGKFVSARFSQEGFGPTNYTKVSENTMIIWETVQSKDEATVSWRGEVENNVMRGVVSLRSKKRAQDFSFITLKWRRR